MAEYLFRIFRYDPEKDEGTKGRVQEYKVDVQEGWTLLDVLVHIKWFMDGTLTFRRACSHGICGSCGMTINGKNGLACETQIKDLGTQVITVEPLRGFRVIKDLVVDMEPFYDKLYAVKPYLIAYTPPPTDGERFQSPEDRRLLDGKYECLLCGCCTSSCPTYWADKDFLGPCALLKAAKFSLDSRDEGWAERVNAIDDKHGIWRCHTIFNCVEACPKELNPTRAIVELRRMTLKGRL